ncbi:SMP-30/gluconolactonase/LRE family protein [Nibrella viscosa]
MMTFSTLRDVLVLVSLVATFRPVLYAQESVELAVGKPDAVVNLATHEGTKLVNGTWRYSDVRLTEVDFRAPGADLKPSGPSIKTNDYLPKAGGLHFDDSQWEVLDPTTLDHRRSTGRLAFNWYRINVTIPARIGSFDPTGSTVVFEIVLDDYAEVWVNGTLPKTYGQSGGTVVKGYNARNRVVIGRNVQPGQQIQLAVFGVNGPLSDLPDNFIWIRSATLDFYKTPPKNPAWQNLGEVVRVDPALDRIIAPGTKVEKLAGGFQFLEGPAWNPEGFLNFSDPNANVIYGYSPDGNVFIYRTKSGYTGFDIGQYSQPGSNGLAFDKEGRLTICEHGNRRVTRIEKNGVLTVLADNHQGKRFNSPNDLTYRSDGALYFTDPPYGLPKFFDDPRKELSFSGVYCVINGQVKLVSTDLKGPNGLAFSPDEKYLYVDNWDITDIRTTKVIMRYEVKSDGSLVNGKVFFNMNQAPEEEALDGLKVDNQGNLFVSGPGGVWIISPAGKHLGTLKSPELPANFAFGDADGKTLYLAARTGLYRIRLSSGGKTAL